MLLRFSVFSDLKMLLPCQTVVLNDAKESLNEVHVFGSEAVSVGSARCVSGGFFKLFFTVTSMVAGLYHMGMSARIHSAVPAPPLLCSNAAVLCSLLQGLL